ncbi:MAG: hypothetical protein ACR2PM_16605 [Hyphomicrobiales bacterium]
MRRTRTRPGTTNASPDILANERLKAFKDRFGRYAVLVSAVALAFALGFVQGFPVFTGTPVSALNSTAPDPETSRKNLDLAGNIIKGKVTAHMERHTCLSSIQFTSLDVRLPDGSMIEVMLPLQVKDLAEAEKLFPAGKVEAFRLNEISNVKSANGGQLYAISDAGLN